MKAFKTELIDLLSNLPGIDQSSNRSVLIQDLVSPNLRKQINWQGSTYVFVTGLVELLAKQRKELLHFLDELAGSDRFGIDRPPLIHQLRGEIAILSPQEWFRVFGPSDWKNWALPDCPYRGLQAFQREHKDLFFGRQKFVDRLLKKIDAEQLVAVIGSSGSGKSSVVFAGLIPQLPENWEVVSFRPGKRPFESLAGALRSANAGEVRKLAGRLREGKATLGEILSTPHPSHTSHTPHTFLLVADQFEELYTLCSEWETRSRFLDCLLEAADSAPGFKLVLTMRADFYDYALRYRPFADALESAYAGLGPMNREELREAISVPAESRGVSLEVGLLERILEDIDKKPDEEENNSNGKQPPDKLPLLEFALKQLWEAADESNYPELTHEAYDDIGGLKLALGKYAEKVYGELQQENLDAKQIKQVFIQLVQPGEETGTGDTRRLATREEIGKENWDLVTRLNQEEVRLVVIGRDEATETETVEVVHEVLISGWSRLTGWMNGNREFRVWQERLRGMLRQWERSGKDRGALLRGFYLKEAEAWLLKLEENISLPERDFIRESLSSQEFLTWQEKLRGIVQLWEDRKKSHMYLLRGFYLEEAEDWLLKRQEDIRLPEQEFIRESMRSRDLEKANYRLKLVGLLCDLDGLERVKQREIFIDTVGLTQLADDISTNGPSYIFFSNLITVIVKTDGPQGLLNFIDRVTNNSFASIKCINDLKNLKVQLQNFNSREWLEEFGYLVPPDPVKMNYIQNLVQALLGINEVQIAERRQAFIGNVGLNKLANDLFFKETTRTFCTHLIYLIIKVDGFEGLLKFIDKVIASGMIGVNRSDYLENLKTQFHNFNSNDWPSLAASLQPQNLNSRQWLEEFNYLVTSNSIKMNYIQSLVEELCTFPEVLNPESRETIMSILPCLHKIQPDLFFEEEISTFFTHLIYLIIKTDGPDGLFDFMDDIIDSGWIEQDQIRNLEKLKTKLRRIDSNG